MFGFANGLLAFLALAAVLDFLPVLRHRRAPAVWWGEERLLFTTRYASVRQKYGAWAFLLGVMVYEFIVVFNNSMARENWPWLQTRVSPVLDWVMYLCFGFKILLGTKYNGRSMVCAGLLYFVARWVYFNGQNIWFLGLVMVLLAAKAVPLRRSLQAFLGCGVPTLALVEVLHFAGIIAPDALSERSGSYRLMFGYGHPNTFGGIVFGLVLAWVLLRQAKITWAEIAAASRTDPMISSLIDCAQTGFARPLTHREMEKLVNLYVQEGFAPETVMLCVAYVASRGKRTMAAVTHELKVWRAEGVETGEQADAHLKLLALRQSREEYVSSLLQISPEELTLGGRKAIARWYEVYGYDDAMVQEAAVQAGPKRDLWYWNSILKTWNAKGLRSIHDVRGPVAAAGASRNIRVDRAAPSGSDILKNATRRRSLIKKPE